jgi:hypothetical protein
MKIRPFRKKHWQNLKPDNLFSVNPHLIANMALGEKLFEEYGQVTSTKVTKVHPVEGTTMEVSFTADIRGIGKFPGGKNLGSGTMTQYPHGLSDASFQGFVTTTDGDQFMWWAHEKSKMSQDGKSRGLVMASGYSNSQKLSWLNQLIIVAESEFDPALGQFKSTAYEWK